MVEFVIAVLTNAAIVFGVSAGAKLRSRRSYRSFRTGLGETQLISGGKLPATAALLVGAEVTVAGFSVAAALATIPTSRAIALTALALVAAGLLTGVLALGVATVMHRGTRAHCACFGSRSALPLGGPHLARNLALLTLLAAALISTAAGPGRAVPGGSAIAVAAGTAAGLLLTHLDDLIALYSPGAPAMPPSAPHRHR